MRAAGIVVRRALDAASAACVPGATTAAIDRAAREVIVAAGADPLFLGYPSADGGMPFPAVTCISVNEEIVHGIPGERRVAEGDLVSIDCGVRLAGWCGDAAVTVPVGRVAADRLALVAAAEEMLALAIRMARPGIRWSEIADAMQAVVLERDLGALVEYVGHGIGRSLHEAPQVPNTLSAAFLERGDFTLRPGMVLAVEPMITLRGAGADADGFPIGIETRRLADGWTVVAADGSPAAHVEHTIAITRRGCVILTAGPAGAADAQTEAAGPA
jgi:methionyl aminopeptidase